MELRYIEKFSQPPGKQKACIYCGRIFVFITGAPKPKCPCGGKGKRRRKLLIDDNINCATDDTSSSTESSSYFIRPQGSTTSSGGCCLERETNTTLPPVRVKKVKKVRREKKKKKRIRDDDTEKDISSSVFESSSSSDSSTNSSCSSESDSDSPRHRKKEKIPIVGYPEYVKNCDKTSGSMILSLISLRSKDLDCPVVLNFFFSITARDTQSIASMGMTYQGTCYVSNDGNVTMIGDPDIKKRHTFAEEPEVVAFTNVRTVGIRVTGQESKCIEWTACGYFM